MKTLEKKHIIPYLNHDVMVIADGDKHPTRLDGIVHAFAGVQYFCNTKNDPDWRENNIPNYADGMKLCLYPLSCLTEEIERNGEKIVPLIEIAKLTEPDFKWIMIDNIAYHYINESDYYVFYYDKLLQVFRFELVCRQAETLITKHPNSQLDCFDMTFKYHIDVFGLIPENLAVDKRTIK